MESDGYVLQSVITDFPYYWFAAQFEYEMSASDFSSTDPGKVN